MPSNIDNIRITKDGNDERLDRRVKLTKEQKQTIRKQYFAMHESERPSQQTLADQHGVSRRLIQYILYPERELRQRDLTKKRNPHQRYYDREKRRAYMQNHRDYKRSLVKTGKL